MGVEVSYTKEGIQTARDKAAKSGQRGLKGVGTRMEVGRAKTRSLTAKPMTTKLKQYKPKKAYVKKQSR